jgi:hypothetical protein
MLLMALQQQFAISFRNKILSAVVAPKAGKNLYAKTPEG